MSSVNMRRRLFLILSLTIFGVFRAHHLVFSFALPRCFSSGSPGVPTIPTPIVISLPSLQQSQPPLDLYIIMLRSLTIIMLFAFLSLQSLVSPALLPVGNTLRSVQQRTTDPTFPDSPPSCSICAKVRSLSLMCFQAAGIPFARECIQH